jgi:hypothetical protein
VCPNPSLYINYSAPVKKSPILLRYYPDRHDKWNPTTITEVDENTTKYFYQIFNNQYLVTRIISWNIDTNITTTTFILEAIYLNSSEAYWWLYYGIELRWSVKTYEVVAGRLYPGSSPTPTPTPVVIDPAYGSIVGQTLVGTDIRSGTSGTLTPSSYLLYGLTNTGTNTALFSSQNAFVEYKWTCNTIQFWYGDTATHTSQITLYYNDPDSGETKTLGIIEPSSGDTYPQSIGSTSFPFDYLKNCVGSHAGGICVDLMTSCNPAVTKGEEECVKSTSQRVSIISNYFSGSFEATVSDASAASNTLTFSDVSFTGSSSDKLSDSSYSSGSGGEISGTIRYGWMGNTYPTPVAIGYAGPIVGQDIFFVCDVSVTVTGPEGSVVAGKSFMAYTANQAGDSNTRSGTKTVTLSGNGNVGSASFTLDPIKWTSTDLATYKSKLSIYFHCGMPGADMNTTYQVVGSVSNIRVLNCRYESYNELIIPSGGLSMTMTYI